MRRAIAAALLAAIVVAPVGGVAQPTAKAVDEERERQFVEALRHEDPASAERYVALRDARQRAMGELQQVHDRVNAAGPALRGIFVGQLRQAERSYADTSLALLDFLEERDRRAIAALQDQIARITQALEERGKVRAELEELRKGK